MLPSPNKMLRLLGQLGPKPNHQTASVKDVLRAALSVLDKAPTPASGTPPPYPCLAQAGIMPDLSALMRNAGVRRGGPAAADAPGRFTDHMLDTPAGPSAYKLYEPSGAARPTAIMVMLHGCTQNPDDFAAGTRMNAVAEANDVLVVYPQQPSSANMQRCWNWFEPQHQRRGAGEPAALAAIIQAVMAAHGIAPGHVMIAGLSAGGAMAAVMAEAYPELFAAVGIHSGLPYGIAHDVGSALGAMRDAGHGRVTPLGPRAVPVPAIVFHGDADGTVNANNAAAIVGRIAAHDAGLTPTSTEGRADGGRAYVTTTGTDARGRVRYESWTVHGAGHAWSGGSVAGTYADPAGPDASAAMMRFFLAHLPQPARAEASGVAALG